MKNTYKFFTPPHWILVCIFALNLAFFTGCMTDADSGSDDDSVTNPQTYTITLDANGGAGSIASITEVAGTEITLPAGTAFTQDGFDYTFAGWNTKPNATGKNYAAGEKITLNSNFTLYAKWGLTAENALKKIQSITESGVHTVSIVGNVADYIAKTDRDTLSQMQEALWALQQSYPDARIILDLSGTDDLTAVPADAFDGRAKFNCENLSGIILPQSVKSIGSYAFNMCKNLVDVVLPKTLDSIEGYAFFNCDNLSEIVIPEGIQELDNIFQDCKTLKNVSLPSTLKEFEESPVPNAGALTFMNCESLKNIVIPDGVTKLSAALFYECSSLESITIPASVTEISRVAFGSCTNLKTVNYKGKKSDWEAIIIDSRSSEYEENANIALSRATIICTDGKIEPTSE